MFDLKSFQGFTPGPWKIAANGKNGSTVRIWRNDPGENEANTGYACIAPHVHGVANASLIAAAPDLLALVRQQEAALRFAAGLISTTPQFADKHPQDALDWIMEESRPR